MHRLFVWLLAASIASPLPAGAITFVDRDFDEVVLLAEQILVGTVVRAASRRVDGGMIVTDFMLGDVEGLHGVDGRSEFTVTTAGGTIGDLTLSIAGAPQLEIGGRYMMFVKGNGSTMFPFIGGPLGIFVVRRLDDGTEQMFSYGGRPVVAAATQGRTKLKTGDFSTPREAVVSKEQFVNAVRTILGAPK